MHPLGFMRIPFDMLMAMDSRGFHYWLQPIHYLVRIAHLLSMAAFFGAIGLLDLRLMGVHGTVSLKSFAEHALPWLYATFGVALISGVALFLYDPVHVGSHGYFVPKLIFTVLGLANAGMFHRMGYLRALAIEGTTPNARVAGFVSLLLWTGVIVCACLNVEAEPKVLLR